MIKLEGKYQRFKGTIYNVWVRLRSIFLSNEDISIRPDNKTGQKYRFEKVGD